MRTLASIQTINTIEPIPNADAIVRARVLGWWIVVKKGEYTVGDQVIYCEIDSLLPERPEFEFLRPGCFKKAQVDPTGNIVLPAGFRIKTIRLRGQVSQGICFPLSFLPPDTSTEIGTDVTEVLGVRKWEPPAPIGMGGRVKGSFPGFLPKTDETRVQVLEDLLERHRGKAFYVTEKLDGTSFTAFVREGSFGICSRNLLIDETDESNVLARVATRLQIEANLRRICETQGRELAIQGEVIGPGIQKNKYGLPEVTLRVFTVIDVATCEYLEHPTWIDVVREIGLEPVPLLDTIVLQHSIDELVAMAEGTSVLNASAQREGIVLRPLRPEHDRDVGRLSFKAINPKFLLKYDE